MGERDATQFLVSLDFDQITKTVSCLQRKHVNLSCCENLAWTASLAQWGQERCPSRAAYILFPILETVCNAGSASFPLKSFRLRSSSTMVNYTIGRRKRPNHSNGNAEGCFLRLLVWPFGTPCKRQRAYPGPKGLLTYRSYKQLRW